MPAWLRVVNSFTHDLATGFWFALVFVAAGLRRELAEAGLLAAGRPVLGAAFHWAVGALVTVLVTGVARAVAYEPPPEPERQVKRRLLALKHALLGVSFVIGTLYVYRLAYA